MKTFFLIFALALLAVAQTATMDQFRNITAAAIGDSAATTETVVLDKPLYFYRDTLNRRHLGVSTPASSPATAYGPGFSLGKNADGSNAVYLDQQTVAWRVSPPVAPGACVAQLSGSNPQTSGQGAWAADKGFFYICVQSGTGFIWARTALQTTW